MRLNQFCYHRGAEGQVLQIRINLMIFVLIFVEKPFITFRSHTGKNHKSLLALITIKTKQYLRGSKKEHF